MSDRTITKIKYAKGRVQIDFQQTSGESETPDEFSLKCSDEPAKSFTKALAALASHVAEICEMPKPEAWAPDLKVRGVSFSWTNDVMGAVITALKPLEHARSPMTVNTPHKSEAPYSPGDPNGEEFCLTGDCAKALGALLKEAEKYIDGKRSQMALPLEAST